MRAFGLRMPRVCALAVILMFTAVPAASAACEGEGVAPAPGTNGPALIPFILTTDCVLDEVRQAHGLGALELEERLTKAAYWHAVDMTTHDFFAHAGSDGKHAAARGVAQGYGDNADEWTIGETLGWGEPSMASPRQIVDAWLASPAHRAVVLNPDFRDVGIMILGDAPVPDVAAGVTYVANFGAEHSLDDDTARAAKARRSCRRLSGRKRARCIRLARQARARA